MKIGVLLNNFGGFPETGRSARACRAVRARRRHQSSGRSQLCGHPRRARAGCARRPARGSTSLAPKEISISRADDYAAILATLARYSTAMDTRDWRLLDDVFTEDLVYDAGEWTTHSRVEYVARLRPYLDGCGPTQHLLGNHRIELDGDEARSAIYVRAFHVGTRELSQTTYEMFGEYRDVLVRTDAGWRSRHRTLRLQYELGSRAVLRPA